MGDEDKSTDRRRALSKLIIKTLQMEKQLDEILERSKDAKDSRGADG